MRISRFEVRILAAMASVAVVALAGALWFGQGAVTEAYEVGINRRLLAQLQEALGVHRHQLLALRAHAARTADAVAFDRRGHAALEAGDRAALTRFLAGALRRYPDVASVRVEGPGGEELARVEHPARLARAGPQPRRVERRTAAGGRVLLTFVTGEAEALRAYARAGEVVEVYALLVTGTSYVSSFYLAVYIAFLLGVMVVALAVGIIVARRVTRRVAVLAEATERVGAGDLTVEVPSDGRDEVAELTRAFNAMVRDIRESRDRIEYLQRIGAWQDFARRLAHEIKNPLTPIQLAVQQLHRTYRGDDERYRRTLEDATAIVEEEVATLRRLVGEFSEFARLPVAVLEEADLGDLLGEAVRGLDPAALLPEALAEQPPPSLDVEPPGAPLPVRVDRQMLRHALDNLVRNAVQAVAAARPEGGGRVVVAARQEDDAAVLEVRDDGPGVPKEHRERVFDPYFTTKDEGTGLGLAIVKKVVLEHGGAIECAQAKEGGAAFRIRLPVLDAGADR